MSSSCPTFGNGWRVPTLPTSTNLVWCHLPGPAQVLQGNGSPEGDTTELQKQDVIHSATTSGGEAAFQCAALRLNPAISSLPAARHLSATVGLSAPHVISSSVFVLHAICPRPSEIQRLCCSLNIHTAVGDTKAHQKPWEMFVSENVKKVRVDYFSY